MANVFLKNVNKVYKSGKDEIHAVIDLNMEVRDGELVALLGPSGCGKTSTLRMIAGLEEITGGDILFGDRRMNDLAPMQRNVAMAFEGYSLYPHMTVYKNIRYPLDVVKMESGEKDKKVRAIAEVFDLEPFLFKRPPQLSGGQQQRVSLARALVRNPEIFLLDEPISHSDAHLRFQMRNQIKRLHYQLSATMIYVTHDQIDALSMADRIAVMNFARLQQIGTRHELYENPVNKFVAGFVGEPHINFFDTAVTKANGSIRLKADSSKNLLFDIPRSKISNIKEQNLSRASVGVRPQNISVEKKNDTDCEVEGEILIAEFIGEKVLTTLKNGDVEFSLLTPTRKTMTLGAKLKAYIPLESVLVFHPETEDII
jgi:multiple sugar transport system ATP-binding protein